VSKVESGQAVGPSEICLIQTRIAEKTQHGLLNRLALSPRVGVANRPQLCGARLAKVDANAARHGGLILKRSSSSRKGEKSDGVYEPADLEPLFAK
jgi:hypothetical protein